jgi:hypothetical protein
MDSPFPPLPPPQNPSSRREQSRSSQSRPPNPYPEHEKLHRAVANGSQQQGEILEWLIAQFTLCEWSEYEQAWLPVRAIVNDLIARFHGVDLNAIEAEKRHMLDEQRRNYARSNRVRPE